MNRLASCALRVPLNDDPHVEDIQDADAFDADDCSIYAEPPRDWTDLIEEELCFANRVDGTHLYRDGATRCCLCGTPHPAIRANACGQL